MRYYFGTLNLHFYIGVYKLKTKRMGSASNNLVIIKGEKEDLLEFKKKAYKNDSEAFSFQQLLPSPDYFEGSEEKITQQQDAYSYLFYGNKWGAGYGILTRYTNNELIYIFNSKDTIANLTYISQKYSNRVFIHIGLSTNKTPLIWSYIKYEGGKEISKYRLPNNQCDFQIPSELYSYEYMSKLYLKFESLIQHKKHIFNKIEVSNRFNETANYKVEYFDLFHKISFLRDNKERFDNILTDVKNLEKQDLNWAMNEIGYRFRTNNLYNQLAFINNNYTSDNQSEYLDQIEEQLKKIKDSPQDIMDASYYLFKHFDKHHLFVKMMKLALSKLTTELDNIINLSENDKYLLKDYPGIALYYEVDNNNLEQLDKYFDLYKWDILEKEREVYYSKLKAFRNLESEFDKDFYEKIRNIELDKTLNQEQRNSKIKQYISEAIDYIQSCDINNKKLDDECSNSGPFPFVYYKDTNLNYDKLKKIAIKYDLSDSFVEFKPPESESNDDLPF